ncbi:MAG: hypothetical protein H6711_33880 [Myxococcales bacterium]|nr:hypothetical protein [Myxococcales bacterium]
MEAPAAADLCSPDEGYSGHLTLEILGTPNPCDLQGDPDVSMDGACVVQTIDDPMAVGLVCDDPNHGTISAILHATSPELRLALCEGDALDIRYASSPLCSAGNASEALTLRAADTERLLAATFAGETSDWFAPFDVSIVDGGCSQSELGGCPYQRLAMRVAVDGGPGELVYDRTLRRLVQAKEYVVAVQADAIDEACCADCIGPPRGTIVHSPGG